MKCGAIILGTRSRSVGSNVLTGSTTAVALMTLIRRSIASTTMQILIDTVLSECRFNDISFYFVGPVDTTYVG